MTSPSILVRAMALCVMPWAVGFAAPANADSDLCVMTFNLRFASSNAPNAWPQRRPVMRECIQKSAPDLIGTQEGVYYQLQDLAEDLPEFEWIGTGRDGGSRGEFMAIFYRKDRFHPLEYDHFWLSDTPHVIGSTTWGNRNRRMVTWVRFLDRRANVPFYFVNTHLDHEIQPAREKAASLIMERMRALKTEQPILLVGDFNAAAGSNKAYQILTEDQFFTDTWNTARERENESIGTFHNYRGPSTGGARIDWILARGSLAVDRTAILTCSVNGQYPSDHFPVAAWLRWTGSQP